MNELKTEGELIMEQNSVKGYKIFNPDWTCRGFKYEVGGTYNLYGELKICGNGFHFCAKANDCFRYYSFDSENKVAEIEALGEVITDGDKSCTDTIHIVREVTWHELLDIVNTGVSNTGLGNSGNRNSGNRNSGNRNSGNWNSGDCNSGNWNNTSYGFGIFNTCPTKMSAFNRQTEMTLEEFYRTEAYSILYSCNASPLEWISEENMTDDEKSENPEYKTTGGFLKKRDVKKAWKTWWSNLPPKKRDIVVDIPGFDADIFEEITGIRVGKGRRKEQK